MDHRAGGMRHFGRCSDTSVSRAEREPEPQRERQKGTGLRWRSSAPRRAVRFAPGHVLVIEGAASALDGAARAGGDTGAFVAIAVLADGLLGEGPQPDRLVLGARDADV